MKNYTDTGMFELIGAVNIRKSENIAIVIYHLKCDIAFAFFLRFGKTM